VHRASRAGIGTHGTRTGDAGDDKHNWGIHAMWWYKPLGVAEPVNAYVKVEEVGIRRPGRTSLRKKSIASHVP